MDLGKAEYELMFRQSPLPMWLYDLDAFRFIDMNQAALKEFGYTRDELLALTLFDIRPASEAPRLTAILESLRGQPAVPVLDSMGIWVYLTKDGRLIDLEVRASTMDVGGRPARLIVARNITEAHAAEVALRES